jgi:hypothetical protein
MGGGLQQGTAGPLQVRLNDLAALQPVNDLAALQPVNDLAEFSSLYVIDKCIMGCLYWPPAFELLK